MTRLHWAGLDLAILIVGMIVYVLAVVLKCRARYVIPAVAGGTLGVAAWMTIRDYELFSADLVGLRLDNLADCLIWLGPATGIFALLLVGYGWWTGKAKWSRRVLVVLPLYLVWGFVQQWIFQGILNNRLQELIGSPWGVPLLVGAVFSAVHAPRWTLVVLTIVIGPVWAFIYTMSPNLFALAVSHAVLGALAYLCVIGEDPLADV
jgi:hypothetical protein